MKNRMHPPGAGDTLKAAPRFKPPRDRMVPTKNVVACPQCKAQIGDPCISSETGLPRKTCHPTRRRMAIRAANMLDP